MAKNRGGHRPAGGIASRQHVEKGVKTGKGAKAAHLGGVSQIGSGIGSHVTNKGDTGFRGDPLFAGPGYNPTSYGNAMAAKTTCGPGGSREVMKSGSQGMTGQPNPGNPPPNPQRDALEGE